MNIALMASSLQAEVQNDVKKTGAKFTCKNYHILCSSDNCLEKHVEKEQT